MNKTYAFTDIHGKYNLWQQIKEFCDETDVIYFLGDACDRGDDGLKIISELLRDPRVRYIKGNHENFFEEIGAELVEGRSSGTPLWRMNGGSQTINDFMKLSEASQIYYIQKLLRLPVLMEYVNKNNQRIILTHAGFTPGLEPRGEYDYLWDREHFYYEWPEGYDDVFIIHGHTPVPNLAMKTGEGISLDEHEIWEPLVYAGGHKIALDMGSAYSGKITLFDLDELKVAKNFYDEEVWKEVE